MSVWKQFWARRAKISRGIYATYIRPTGAAYDADTWWDGSFYTSGVSDRKTIYAEQDQRSTLYHYSSVENLILRHLCRRRFEVEGRQVLDIGSGAGHWIDFYRELGAQRVVGIDVSKSSVDHLREKFRDTDAVEVHQGTAQRALESVQGDFALVNAIGVMFHIVDDQAWRETLRVLGERLEPSGLLVVGGHFGWVDGVNVQIDAQGQVNKRLRSRGRWKRALRELGFGRIRFYTNRAYLRIPQILPENSLLVAQRD